MTEREQLLYDLGKFAAIDKEIYADMKSHPDTPIGEQLKAHVPKIGEKNWEVAKDVYIDGNGTDGERQAFCDGFMDGQRAIYRDCENCPDNNRHYTENNCLVKELGFCCYDETETFEQLKADYENDPVEHAKRLIEKSTEKGLKEFRHYCDECIAFLAGLPEEECERVIKALAEYYDETPSTTAQDGQRAAAGISPTSEEKRQEGSTDAPKTANNVELFNFMKGASFIPKSERNKHPNAEYFMAQIDPKSRVFPSWEPDEVKSVTLTFRKLVTVKDGEIVDITKSGEKAKAVAVEDGGKLFLRVGGSTMDDNIVGVLVRIAISVRRQNEA